MFTVLCWVITGNFSGNSPEKYAKWPLTPRNLFCLQGCLCNQVYVCHHQQVHFCSWKTDFPNMLHSADPGWLHLLQGPDPLFSSVLYLSPKSPLKNSCASPPTQCFARELNDEAEIKQQVPPARRSLLVAQLHVVTEPLRSLLSKFCVAMCTVS